MTSRIAADVGGWALITGAAGRAAAQISRDLHARGVDVVLHCRESSAAKAAALQDEFDRIRPGSCDVWVADLAVEPLPWGALNRSIDYLVCNGSEYRPSEVGDLREGLRSLQIHLLSHAAIIAHCLPTLVSVVAIGDVHVRRPAPGQCWYNVGKSALAALMSSCAVEFGSRTRFNAVLPGSLPYPADWTDDERARRIMETIPMGRLGEFRELASAVVWLLLDATYCNGTFLSLDGGRDRYLP